MTLIKEVKINRSQSPGTVHRQDNLHSRDIRQQIVFWSRVPPPENAPFAGLFSRVIFQPSENHPRFYPHMDTRTLGHVDHLQAKPTF